MSRVRVYLPLTATLLRSALDQGELGPAPLRGRAVTEAWAAELGDADEEEQEYAAMTAAALDAVRLLGPDDPPVRVVAAVDVGAVRPDEDEEAGVVVVEHPVALRRLAAVHVDSDAATADVAAARSVPPGDPGEEEALRRCLEHDLEWYARNELTTLVERWSTSS